MRERLSLLIGRILLVGLMISLLLTAVGGTIYLRQHGLDIDNFQIFQKEPYAVTSRKIWDDALTFSSVGIIQLGILVLILTQILRVALLVGFYLKIQDFRFLLLSFFILVILVYSLFWAG